MKTFVIAATAAILLTTASFAAPKHVKMCKAKPKVAHAKVIHAKVTGFICPITGNKIASIKDAVGHSTYKGKTYYFCCPMCKPMFDKAPAATLAKAAKGKYSPM